MTKRRKWGAIHLHRKLALLVVTVILSSLGPHTAAIGVDHKKVITYTNDPSDPYPQRGFGKKIVFDPSKCSQDPKGMTYVALGKTVFAHPSYKIYDGYYQSAKDNKEVLGIGIAPDDPAGCPGNPVQHRGAFFLMSFDAVGEDRLDGGLTLAHEPVLPESHEYVMSGEKFFDMLCANPEHKTDNSIEGIDACSIGIRKTDETIVYKATDYLTPIGRKFTFECKLDERFKTLNTCSVTYKLNKNIRMRYGFPPGYIPIDKLIAYDKALRSRIEAEEVKEYHWITEPTVQK